MQNQKKSILICVGIVVIVSLLLGINKMSKMSKGSEKLIFSVPDSPSFALIYIARHEGYFKEEGLDITYKKVLRGVDSIDDVIKGQADIAFSYEAPFVIKAFDNKNINIIGTLHTSTKNTGIVARKDKGISKPSDLKGKKIGVTKNTAYDFFLQSYLLSQGIKLSDNILRVDTAAIAATTLLGEASA